jgi:hypothetical protein
MGALTGSPISQDVGAGLRRGTEGLELEGITLHDRYCYDTMCVTMEIAITFFIDHMEQEVQP